MDYMNRTGRAEGANFWSENNAVKKSNTQMKKSILKKMQCEIRYGIDVKLVSLTNEIPFKFKTELRLAYFIRDNRMACHVMNLKCLPVKLQGIALSAPSKVTAL